MNLKTRTRRKKAVVKNDVKFFLLADILLYIFVNKTFVLPGLIASSKIDFYFVIFCHVRLAMNSLIKIF